MYSMSNGEEGCGKWLTARGTTNHKRPTKKDAKAWSKQHPHIVAKSAPPSNPSRISLSEFPSFQNRLWPMKQSKINKFLVNKPKQFINSGTSSKKLAHPPKLKHLTTKAPMLTFPMKRNISVADYDELWGSEEESEDEKRQQKLGSETKSTTCQSFEVSPKLDVAEQNKSVEKHSYHKENRLPRKKVKQMENSENMLFKSDNCSRQNEIQLTQWLQEQVEEFCRHSKCESSMTNLSTDVLASVKLENISSYRRKIFQSPEKSVLLSQFSEWFNEQVETAGQCKNTRSELDENWKDSSTEDNEKKFAFSQWFDAIISKSS